MRFNRVLILAFFLLLTGCVDSRVKRVASLLNVKTHVATEEFNTATTSEAKVQVASEYFRNAGAITQIIDDSLAGRAPTNPVIPNP